MQFKILTSLTYIQSSSYEPKSIICLYQILSQQFQPKFLHTQINGEYKIQAKTPTFLYHYNNLLYYKKPISNLA